MNGFPQDDEFREEIVTKATDDSITGESGWSLFVPEDSPVKPAVGMVARFYGRGIGYPVRGLFLDGQRVFYRTEAEQRAQFEADAARRQSEREAEFEAKREETDRRIEALPEDFRRRIYRFQQHGGRKFRVEFEPYELFVCEQAVAIASAFTSEEEIEAFREKPWADKMAAVPALTDQHSGNTFGCSVVLAKAVKRDPTLVTKIHGALTPLVGCAEYGCHHEESVTP